MSVKDLIHRRRSTYSSATLTSTRSWFVSCYTKVTQLQSRTRTTAASCCPKQLRVGLQPRTKTWLERQLILAPLFTVTMCHLNTASVRRAYSVCEYHVGLHSLAILWAPLVDVLSSLVGAHKTDGFDGRVVTDEVYRCTNKEKSQYFLFFCVTPSGHNIRALIRRFKFSCFNNACRLLTDIGCTVYGNILSTYCQKGIWLMFDSSLDLSLLFMTHTDCELLNEQGITHSPACCPWIMLTVPSGAPASWSILAKSMVQPGTRSEGFIR